MVFRRLVDAVERPSPTAVTVLGFALILVVAIGDYLTGRDLAFSFFYVVPILLISWVAATSIALFAALFAALVAGVAFPVTDYFAGELEGLWIPTWNFVVRSGRSQPSPD